jgi:hypothetical protein
LHTASPPELILASEDIWIPDTIYDAADTNSTTTFSLKLTIGRQINMLVQFGTTALAKVQTVKHWPIPSPVTNRSSFYDMTAFHRKFIQNYGLLSRAEHNISAIYSAIPLWILEIEASYTNDPHYTTLPEQVFIKDQSAQHYSAHSGNLRTQGRTYIGHKTDSKNTILSSLHSYASGGHSGIKVTSE